MPLVLDFVFGVAQNPDAIMQSVDQFTLLQGGGFHRTMLSFLEIDEHGSVNVHHLPTRRHVTAGVGGFADIVSAAPEIVFIGSFTAGRRDIAVADAGATDSAHGVHTSFVKEVSSPDLLRAPRPRQWAEGYLRDRTRTCSSCAKTASPSPRSPPESTSNRDVLDRSEFPLQVSEQLKIMDARLFAPERIGLTLNPTPPHARIAGLTDGTGARPGGTAAVQESHP